MHYNYSVHRQSELYQREMRQKAAKANLASEVRGSRSQFHHRLLASVGQQMVSLGERLQAQADHRIPAQLQTES